MFNVSVTFTEGDGVNLDSTSATDGSALIDGSLKVVVVSVLSSDVACSMFFQPPLRSLIVILLFNDNFFGVLSSSSSLDHLVCFWVILIHQSSLYSTMVCLHIRKQLG